MTDEGRQAYLCEKIDHYTDSFVRNSLQNMKKVEPQDLYVASYCANQNMFHVESVHKMISLHTNSVFNKKQLEYVPFFFGTYDDCNSHCERLKEILYAAYNQD